MPKYLLSGTDDRGRQRTEVITAPTGDEATRRFKARGYLDVTLHSDEVVGHLFNPKVLKHLTPRDCLALGRVSRGQYLWLTTVKLYRSQWWVFLIFAALIVGRRVLDAPWGLIDSAAVGFLLLPPIIVVLGELVSPSRKFERAMTYNAWGRWAEMLTALQGVRGMVPAPHFAFLQAKALAGLGRLDEALETVRP